MGIYLNPGHVKFQKAVDSEIYIDKTEMITYLNSVVNTEQCYVSVSRPRRFGKTIAANMLCAYYGKGDSRELFSSLKIAGHDNWDKYLNHFDVIRVVMTDFIKDKRDVETSLKTMASRIMDDLAETYPDVKYDPEDLFYSKHYLFWHRKSFHNQQFTNPDVWIQNKSPGTFYMPG